MPGIVDGHHPRARTQPCHGPPLQHQRRRPDRDDDDGRGSRGPSWGIPERGRQAIDIPRQAGGNAGVGGSRERTRSPSAYRRRDAGYQEVPMDGDHGRSAERGVQGSPRARDPPRREDVDWECRHSRSPLRHYYREGL